MGVPTPNHLCVRLCPHCQTAIRPIRLAQSANRIRCSRLYSFHCPRILVKHRTSFSSTSLKLPPDPRPRCRKLPQACCRDTNIHSSFSLEPRFSQTLWSHLRNPAF